MMIPKRLPIHGNGRAVLKAFGREATFSELSFSYPLKLVSPKISSGDAATPVAIVYILSYGGGLVSGDRIDLDMDIGENSSLLVLTQGSTKVFQARGPRKSDLQDQDQDSPPSSPNLFPTAGPPYATTQKLHTTIAPGGFLLLLPDPLTCFAGASYSQTQTFVLNHGASLVLLDWYTSGRMHRGEAWAFQRYRSTNEVWMDSPSTSGSKRRRVARDALLLEEDEENADVYPMKARTLKDRMGPFHCYATIHLFGPKVQAVVASIQREFETIRVFQQSKQDSLVWSFSALEEGNGGIVRVAGEETELVRDCMKRLLAPLGDVVGAEAWSKALL
ncbi:hypothetical protein FRB94_008196 [Tulasnella sp. JGI-2019a]|nr:hypothetical protein FRB93_006708 [Tulasnella sp. JGI-2019a]KAG8996597.1 hypothetical protein FRB94_008196 [Tulasnella sp. JGI-2019a]